MPFLWDDCWYATNLVTNGPLKSIGDIWEGQVWHYLNWGGRSVNHTVLQLVSMGGETFADFMNILMTVALSMVCCKASKVRHPMGMLAVNVYLILANPAFLWNMFWQSGAANYLYSTTWILLFVWVYMDQLDCEKRHPLIEVWILPLGLMTGWSNENMGPAAFLVCLGIVWSLVKKGRRLRAWMVEGLGMNFIGSCLLLLAPGNFVRANEIKGGLWERIRSNLSGVVQNTFGVLLMIVLVTVVILFVRFFVQKKKLNKRHLALLSFAILAQGAMVLSPTYPDRACFGVLTVLIVLDFSLIGEFYRDASSQTRRILWGILGISYMAASLNLLCFIRYPALITTGLVMTKGRLLMVTIPLLKGMVLFVPLAFVIAGVVEKVIKRKTPGC